MRRVEGSCTWRSEAKPLLLAQSLSAPRLSKVSMTSISVMGPKFSCRLHERSGESILQVSSIGMSLVQSAQRKHLRRTVCARLHSVSSLCTSEVFKSREATLHDS